MDYVEFRRQLGKAGLTAEKFADLVKMNPKSISNYTKHANVPSHLAVMVVLMAEMAENKINFESVLEKLQIETKKPRGVGKGRFGGNKRPTIG